MSLVGVLFCFVRLVCVGVGVFVCGARVVGGGGDGSV